MSDEYLQEKLRELSRLPPTLHWFCPRFDDHAESTENHDPDHSLSIKTEDSLLNDVDHRRQQAVECLKIFGYDGGNVMSHQRWLIKHIDAQLGKCLDCITEYYKSKRREIDRLRLDYHQEEVDLLVGIFDNQDFERIKRGLENATKALESAESSQRGYAVMNVASQFALFEALSCDAFLQDTDLVRRHLDTPMKLVQTNKRLSVSGYVPAATYFLFDPEPERCIWARRTWSRVRNRMSKDDFDFAVRDPLARYMRTLTETFDDALVPERFWYGMQLIVEKLDKELVTHSLLALEIDVCRLALDHLQIPTPALRFLLQTIRGLLEIAPENFWGAMGAISSTTVIEQIFNNPQYDRYMIEAREREEFATSPLNDLLAWIQPFMASLKPSHQIQPCRSLSFQMLDRLQDERFAPPSRLACQKTGLLVLEAALSSCNSADSSLGQVRRMVTMECLEVVATYIQRVITIVALPSGEPSREQLGKPAVNVIKLALSLECKSLREDREILKLGKELPSGFCSHTSATWDAVVHRLDRGNLAVARAALCGVKDLFGLEKFENGADCGYTKGQSEFNGTFGKVTHLVCLMLERLNEFSPSNLDRLFEQPDTATALVASLFSPDASTYEAGVNLIKTISSEVARKEAIGHLLQPFFDTTLNAFSWAIRRIANNKTYASCPRMLKTLQDVLDVLCNPQNGLLRTRTLASVAEHKAVRYFWESQWDVFRVIYEMTERWSRLRVDPGGNESMKEFCRDTMDLSDHLFDQYSVFANALNAVTEIKQEEGMKEIQKAGGDHELLGHPATAMQDVVTWLRLRDHYLASTSASLTQKILYRLSDADIKVADKTVQFLEGVLRGSSAGKTNLNEQEKAKVARALERNLGRPIHLVDTDNERSDSSRATSVSRDVAATRKSGNAIDFDKWSSKARQRNNLATEDGDRSPVSDPRLGELKGLQAFRASGLGSANHGSMTVFKSAQHPLRSTKQESEDAARAAFKEKRQKEMEAKKKRDAEVAAKMKSKGLGVEGKDHAPRGPSMMVSSSSESDSQDELDAELFGSAPKVSAATRDYHLSRLKAKEHQGPVKKPRQVRSAKDMRARLAPDLVSLHQTILGWEYFHHGDFPPGTGRQNYSQVPDRFRTPLDYQQVFEPLLILEAWNGFLKSREENSNSKPFTIKVANRMTVDSFLEVSTTMPMAEGQELGIAEADIVLLSKDKSPTDNAQQPHCLGRVHRITRKKAVMEISYRINPSSSLMSAMVPNATIYGARILSVTPLEREYGALLGLKYFDLCDEVIQAKPSPLLQYPDQQLSSLVTNYKVNKAQAKAIKSAIDNDAFTLIQGPPGSGKTKTIVAIVGAILSESLKDKGVAIARPKGAEAAQYPTTVANKKLLVCAPSNAAVDELVMRFMQGIKTVHGEDRKISIVRLGRSDAINSNVKDVTLDELVNAKLNLASAKKEDKKDDIGSLMTAHKAACDEFSALRIKVEEMRAQGKQAADEDNRQFEILKRRKQQLSNNIDTARDSGNSFARDAEINRRQIQQGILDGAHVICATLSGSGHDLFQNLNIEFETVIIDEAAQSIELSALIPLKYGCSKCILVGDPKQLPPTVFSREAARFQYEQSLFVRMQTNHPNDVHLLDTQYRMHPEISSFPSAAFYEGKLLDGPDMLSLRAKPWHKSDMLGPYRFFDVYGTHQSAPQGHSLINRAEIEVALRLYERLTTDCQGYNFQNRIGIITPYKSQLRELKARFATTYGRTILETVEFNTTDAFQGRESDIIIFSCVRASINKSIGFLDDIRRMNVGITRAKCSLWVLGNSQSLRNGEFWAKLIEDAQRRNRFSGGNLVDMLQKPLEELRHATKRTSISAVNENETSDVEMADAPVSPRKATQFPSGGMNGLNDLANCQRCGSAAHMTHLCDNAHVKSKCHRCGDEDHFKDQCTAERCLKCGVVGHPSRLCYVRKELSVEERRQVIMDENKHRSYQQKAPLIRAKKQLGDHDKNVPVVRTTKTTPPGSKALESLSVPDGKRKRENSPPPNSSHRPAGPNSPTNGSGKPNGNIPTGPRNSNSASMKRYPGAPANRPTGRPATSMGSYPNDSSQKEPPEPTPTTKKLGINRPSVPANNVRPPMKKRKEASPFIVPKDRRPKRP
ncbi:MAG: hypothetical protein Q9166_002761 [cf. Caloplaca sp. 2 TL-2023]